MHLFDFKVCSYCLEKKPRDVFCKNRKRCRECHARLHKQSVHGEPRDKPLFNEGPERVCMCCGETKSDVEFKVNTAKGWSKQCHKCRSDAKAMREEHGIPYRTLKTHNTCCRCGDTKAITLFRKGTKTCKECHNIERARLRKRQYDDDGNEILKQCFKCKVKRPFTDFKPQYNQCNICLADYFREKNAEYREKYRFKQSLRGIAVRARDEGYAPCDATPEELEEAFTGKCEACGVSEENLNRRLHADHCHETGVFRAWLCSKCNSILGLANDDPITLFRLIKVLKHSPAARREISSDQCVNISCS